MKKLIIIIVSVILFTACQDNTPSPGVLMTKEKLLTVTMPGYQWFSQVYNDYIPNDSIINLIKSEFDPTQDTIYIYSKPACSCGDDEAESFAQLIKVLTVANIPEANYLIYSMSSVKSSQPYAKKFTLNQLPSYMVTYNGNAVYSIYDTVFVEKVKELPNIRSMEAYLLSALKKF